jgi:hypothetical protein
MTEQEWLACSDPGPMLVFLGGQDGYRKLRLFAAACCRRVWHLLTNEGSRFCVEVAERYADRRATIQDMADLPTGVSFAHGPEGDAHVAAICCTFDYGSGRPPAARAATAIAGLVAGAAGGIPQPDIIPPACVAAVAAEKQAQAALLRDIFGPLPFRPVTIQPQVLAWNDRLVVRLAQSIYDQRNWSDMAVLHDALLDAGCDEQEVLDHCKGPGPHSRGCWIIDLLLNKE